MEIKDHKAGFTLRLLHTSSGVDDENIDIEVVLASGERYTATFATLANISTILARYKTSGECLSGKYFWARELVLVDDLHPECVHAVVADLLKKGEMFSAFGGPHVD